MPWREVSAVSERCEFVRLACVEGTGIRELCRRFGISPKTGYKWLRRYRASGRSGLDDRSRRPHRSPRRTPATMEAMILAVRDRHPAWGGRKIAAWLTARGQGPVPSPGTITAILRRHDRIDPAESAKHKPWRRFEHPAPNDLWQMDFMGHFALTRAGRCHPLTVLDDHSRFAVCLRACRDETRRTVETRLTGVFKRYGLPDRILADNGSPWGGMAVGDATRLGVWLMRLGIRLVHGRPYHPQTQGKDERFHRTVRAELVGREAWPDLVRCQTAFDGWRDLYNLERPHQALDMATPASRYRPSRRAFPTALPPIEYGEADAVRRVQQGGRVHYRGREYRVGRAFVGQPVALRPTAVDGVWALVFCRQVLGHVNLHVNHEPGLLPPGPGPDAEVTEPTGL